MGRFSIHICLFVLLIAGTPSSRAISIQFDYSYDTNGFFNTAAKRTALSAAAHVFETTLTDNLLAITPNGSNRIWDQFFIHPSASDSLTRTGPSIAVNTLIIYVGAKNLGGSYAHGIFGSSAPAGINSPQSWSDLLKARGQSGALTAPSTDFGPWGGALSFDLNTTWYFDTDPSTNADLPGNCVDFYTVAVHELAHILGLGASASWAAQRIGSYFEGSNARAANNATHVALSGVDHWASGTMSNVYGTNILQEACMCPTLAPGVRKYFTTLDFAGLKDVGWQVAAPEQPPPLKISLSGNSVTISWPLTAVGWTLEKTSDMAQLNGWQAVNAQVVDTASFHTVTIGISTTTNQTFFRLVK